MKIINVPDKSEMKLTNVCHALGDPLRMKIVLCLARTGERNCSAFEADHVSKSTLSHHVKTLREAGVITPRIEGKQHFYSIRWDDMNKCFPGLLDALLHAKEDQIY